MKTKHFVYLLLSVIMMGTFACDDDENTTSVQGRWQATRAKADVVVLGGVGYPIDETDFDAVVEFKENNVLTITDDGQTVTGSWSQSGETLTITVEFTVENINLSGKYTIKEINSTSLEIYTEREEMYTIPNSSSQVQGTVKATLFFNKLP